MTVHTPAAGAGTQAASGPLLCVRDLHVRFPGAGAEAVAGLDLELPPAGALAIVGESGSGKTVGMRSVLGLQPASATVTGTATFGGDDLITMPRATLRSVRGRRIAMVFQNAMEAFNPTLTLKRQLTEHLLWHGICDRKEATRRAIEAMGRVGIDEPAKRIRMYPFQFSGGMLQRAMIAQAIVTEPDLLIADEPTTALDVTVQRQVLDMLRNLREDGLALIMITHDLGVARYTCDDVVVMRHGAVVESGSMPTFARTARHPYSRELIAAAVDLDLDGDGRGQSEETDAERPDAGDQALVTATGLHKVFHVPGGSVHAVNDVTIGIRRGEALGVVGQSGSGKSTLARLIMRLVDVTSGAITFDGADLLAADRAQLRRFRRQAQMVFQNPFGSLLPHLSAAANVAEPLRLHKWGGSRKRTARAHELLEMVGIDATLREHYPHQLSGGQQQRVAIARALALEPALLVCDEPTSALDVSIQAEVLALLAHLREQLSLSMLFVTHNLAVAQQLCDRIVVMASGVVVETAPTEALFTRPQHAYTRALLSAVLPAHTDPLPAQPGPDDVDAGALTQVDRDHWVRRVPATTTDGRDGTRPDPQEESR